MAQTASSSAPQPFGRAVVRVGAVACAGLMILAAIAYPELAPYAALTAALAVLVRLFPVEPRQDVPAAASPPRTTPDARGLAEAALESLPEPLIIVRGGDIDDIGDRRIVWGNGAACRAFKLSEPGREDASLVSILRDPGLLEAVDEALFGGRSQAVEYQTGGVQGRHMSAWVAPLPGEDEATGEPRALIRLRDETDARRAEMMRVDFLANASHELRTPLASLAGFIETLRGHAREDPVAQEKFLGIMAVQAERMTRLVSDLLSLSRIELNEHIPPAGKVDMAAAVRDVIDATAPLAERRGIRLLLETGDAMSHDVIGDRDQIIQVIQNLTDNALKYSPDGGQVELRLEADLASDAAASTTAPGLSLLTPDRSPETRYVRLSVRDHGPGLSRETMPRLTERFYRVEGQKSGERLGTGLGLAIVKHIVNRHHGGLTVQSVPGEGAAFSAYVPMSARAPK